MLGQNDPMLGAMVRSQIHFAHDQIDVNSGSTLGYESFKNFDECSLYSDMQHLFDQEGGFIESISDENQTVEEFDSEMAALVAASDEKASSSCFIGIFSQSEIAAMDVASSENSSPSDCNSIIDFIEVPMQECDQNLQSYYKQFDPNASSSFYQSHVPLSQNDVILLVAPQSPQRAQPSCPTSNLQLADSARVGRPAVPDKIRDKIISNARSKGDHKTLKREKNNKSSAIYRNNKKAKATKIEMEEEEEKHKNEGLLRRVKRNKKIIKTLQAQLRELFHAPI